MSIFPNISLGRNTKRYTHNMSFDNNTTMPFGVVQPLMSQRLEANSKISVNLRQLVRLAPMPVPTFARLNMVNEVSFVPTVDVCPYYEALVSQMSYSNGTKTFYPTKLPYTTNCILLWNLLFGFDSYYSIYGRNKRNIPSFPAALSKLMITLADGIFGSLYPSGLVQLHQEYVLSGDDSISADGADFFFEGQSDASDDASYFIVCVRFGPLAHRLRSVLLGLGYSLNPTDNSPVSLIPLLSYYKAWFDLYYPVRSLNWTDTYCYKLIKLIEDYSNYSAIALHP